MGKFKVLMPAVTRTLQARSDRMLAWVPVSVMQFTILSPAEMSMYGSYFTLYN
jgi:hypothetical protein